MSNIIANDMLFVNDEEVIGKWEHFDIISSIEEFDCNKPNNSISSKAFREIYFLPNGEKYWIFEGWTKGYLLIHYGGDEPILSYKYTLKKIENKTYMFLVIIEDEKSYINVLKKVSSKKFIINEIGRRDNIDLPFILDEKILGQWKSIGFVNNIDDFTGPVFSHEDLWLKSICFYEDGKADRLYSDETWSDMWTKGFLLDRKKSTASAYEIRIINGTEYLFIQWKMGNYVYGGVDPSYYVFIRVCSEYTK
ncbi:hypothetical protein ACWGXJ_04315 [Paenibacillus sp. S33]